jgi:hypothetical protein
MLSRKRLVLIIALAAGISISTISPASLSRDVRRLAAPLTVLQGGANEQDKPTAAEVATTKKNERKLRVLRMQRMPVAVTEVRNLQSETWYKDLEIEIKNVSDKPIYFLIAQLTFPDDYSDRSKIALLSLKFGLPKYFDISVVGNSLDPHLKPGETCVLRLHEYYWDILRQREKRFPERLRSFVMGFGRFSFGDQTGFTSENGWADYRAKKHQATSPRIHSHRPLAMRIK